METQSKLGLKARIARTENLVKEIRMVHNCQLCLKQLCIVINHNNMLISML